MSPNDSQTFEKILYVAEETFAVHGFFASSLRQITRDAQVNVAAVHYHFGSKEALFLAVLNRRILPYVNMVLEQIDLIAQSKALQAEDLVHSLASSSVRYAQNNQREAVLVTRLVSRLMLDDYKVFREQLAQEYDDFVQRFLMVFQRVLPHLPKEEVRWRMHLAISTIFNAFAGNDVLKALAHREWVSAKEPTQVMKFVVPFVVAGLNAPATSI